MRTESFAFLRKLVDTAGPSGYEQRVQDVFRTEVAAYADEVRTDVLGNVIAIRNPSGQPRVMLAGHADEIGFQIRYISDEGMLYFGSIGGHDPVVASGQRVNVHTAQGPVIGVLGRKAVHLLDADERDKAPKLKDSWIDIGASNRKEAEEIVSIGDCVTYAAELVPLRGDLYAARSFDDKMGAFIVGEVLRLLGGKDLKAAVCSVSTVQEEVGFRGSTPSAYALDAQVGIATDVTHATDYPSADKKHGGDLKLGGGPAIGRGANVNPQVYEILVSCAKDLGIPYCIEALPGPTGTDANVMQMARAGMATGLVSVPLRYMHTPNEVMDLRDIENSAALIARFCECVTPDMEWTPR